MHDVDAQLCTSYEQQNVTRIHETEEDVWARPFGRPSVYERWETLTYIIEQFNFYFNNNYFHQNQLLIEGALF